MPSAKRLAATRRVTFRTGAARQVLSGPRNNLVTVDPTGGKPTYTFYSVNYQRLRVRAYAVTPGDWPAYLDYLSNRWQDPPPTPPGREVINKIIQLDAADDALTETSIDLSSALSRPHGPSDRRRGLPTQPALWQQRRLPRRACLGPGHPDRSGRAQRPHRPDRLDDRSPDRRAAARRRRAICSANRPRDHRRRRRGAVRAAQQLSPDCSSPPKATTPPSSRAASTGIPTTAGVAQTVQDEVRWYVFDDRAMYRPGEEVHVKGWVRRIENDKGGDIRAARQGHVRALPGDRPAGRELVDDVTDVNDLGGFDFSFYPARRRQPGLCQHQSLAERCRV